MTKHLIILTKFKPISIETSIFSLADQFINIRERMSGQCWLQLSDVFQWELNIPIIYKCCSFEEEEFLLIFCTKAKTSTGKKTSIKNIFLPNRKLKTVNKTQSFITTCIVVLNKLFSGIMVLLVS